MLVARFYGTLALKRIDHPQGEAKTQCLSSEAELLLAGADASRTTCFLWINFWSAAAFLMTAKALRTDSGEGSPNTHRIATREAP